MPLPPRDTSTAGRPIEHLVADAIAAGQFGPAARAHGRGERGFAAVAHDRRLREVESPIAPEDLHDDATLVPVEDLGGIGGDDRFARHRGTQDAERLPRLDDHVVGGVVVAAGDGLGDVARVADGVLVIDLVAAAGIEARFVGLDDVARPIDHPLDAPRPARLAVLVVDGGDQDDLRAERGGHLRAGADFELAGLGVEVLEVAGPARLGVFLGNVARREQIREVAGVVRTPRGRNGERNDDDRGSGSHAAAPRVFNAGPYARLVKSARRCSDSAGHFLEGRDEAVDVRLGVERAGADADEAVGEGAERPVDVRGAVQAGPDGDVERLVEDAAEFGRRHAPRCGS